jgi:hypothetical protein
MNIRWFALAMGLGLAAAGLAQAAAENDSRLKEAFGSTIVSTYPDGRQAQLWLREDGSYKAEGRRRDISDGAWQVKDGKLCLRQRHPFPAPFTFCTPVPASLDHPWTGKAFTGEQIKIKLVKAPSGRDEDTTRKAGSEETRAKTSG